MTDKEKGEIRIAAAFLAAASGTKNSGLDEGKMYYNDFRKNGLNPIPAAILAAEMVKSRKTSEDYLNRYKILLNAMA